MAYRLHQETEVGVLFVRDGKAEIAQQFTHEELRGLGNAHAILVERGYFDPSYAAKKQLRMSARWSLTKFHWCLGKPVPHPRLACLSSIASAEGIHSKTLENVLRVAGVVGEKPPMEGAPNVVLDYARAKVLIDNMRYAIPVTRVPDMLSAYRPIVAALIDIGELTRIQEHGELRSKLGKAIDARSIQKTLSFLRATGRTVGEPPGGYVSLAKAAEKTRINLRAILELLFRQFLDHVYLLDGYAGFDAVLVSPDEISECVRNPPPDASDEIRFYMQ